MLRTRIDTGLASVHVSASPSVLSPTYPDLPTGMSSFGAATLGEHVYVYGGHAGRAHNYSKETTRGELCRLNLRKPAGWEELAAGPNVQGLALVGHGDKLYRIGGMQPQNAKTEKTDTRSLGSCGVFDPQSGQWSDIEPLSEPRSSHDAIVVGNVIYVFGGWQLNGTAGKSEWHAHGLRLDLAVPDAKWERVDQPFQRRALVMAALDDRVFVVGGLGDSGKVERTVSVFDTRTGTWSDGPALPGEDGNGFTPAAAVQGGRLYVTPADGKLYQLSDSKDAWTVAGQFKAKRFAARMVPGPDGRLVLLGGASLGALLASVEAIVTSGR
jgi:N-acetylneuraminic acid mutarotase